MGLLSKLYTKLGICRFHIVANDKCPAVTLSLGADGSIQLLVVSA